MQAPLEPFDYPNVNPGRNTLTVDASPEENIERLHWTLARTTNYTGIMNYMGARFVADADAMGALMAEPSQARPALSRRRDDRAQPRARTGAEGPRALRLG